MRIYSVLIESQSEVNFLEYPCKILILIDCLLQLLIIVVLLEELHQLWILLVHSIQLVKLISYIERIWYISFSSITTLCFFT
jgi:hypothetical protein